MCSGDTLALNYPLDMSYRCWKMLNGCHHFRGGNCFDIIIIISSIIIIIIIGPSIKVEEEKNGRIVDAVWTNSKIEIVSVTLRYFRKLLITI